MKADWQIFIESDKEATAARVLARFSRELGATVNGLVLQPYHKGGHVAKFEITLESDRWNDCVVEVIALGQRVAHQWLLTGSVRESLDGWSHHPSVIGITNVGWSVMKANNKPGAG